MRTPAVFAAAAVLTGAAIGLIAQGPDAFLGSRDDPAIGYATRLVTDPVSQVNRTIADGSMPFVFDKATGYLPAALAALKVPVESQVLVFSQTSAQAPLINPQNPRAIFFNDAVAVGWVRGADDLELAAHDPQQGVIFYTMRQAATDKPRFTRDDSCLQCHLTWDTLGVPGWFTLSTFPMIDDPNAYASGFVADHRSPLPQRWGGWYVTGRTGALRHTGNVPVLQKGTLKAKPSDADLNLTSVDGRFDTNRYLSHFSDVVALLVLEHQARMINLLTRMGWEARVAESRARAHAPIVKAPGDGREPAERVEDAAATLVDYLLFVDEAPMTEKIQGSSGFAEKFAAEGPRDTKGRSLRELDLEHRLLRYPCSYMIYSAAFDALPADARAAIYARLWEILSGRERQAPYNRLKLADRQAIVEILRDTKRDLPEYFKSVTR